MAMMSLAEHDKFDIDGPVKKYLSRFELSDPSLTQTLTIRDLLSHAKGINSHPMVFLDAFTGEITEDRYYETLKSAAIRNKFAYSNSHYTLAGRVAEAVTGKPWKDVLAERIFEPAGMTRTTAYASRMYADPDAAIPCATEDGKLVPARLRKTDATMHAAGGMGASIADLATWLELNLNGGVVGGKRVVSEASVREMQKMQAKMDEPDEFMPGVMREGYGLGWQIGTYKDVPRLEHGGGYTGTSAHISFMPQHNIGVAAVANAGAPLPHLVAMDVYDRLLKLGGKDIMPDLMGRSKQRMRRAEKRAEAIRNNPVTEKSLSLPIDKYIGTYVNSLWGTVVIERNGERLTGRVGDLPLTFSAAETDRFGVLVGDDGEEAGRFEVAGEKVPAVIIAFALGDTDVRFDRAK
jgi:CubicO group peptidase (beta-lactamase class C family)